MKGIIVKTKNDEIRLRKCLSLRKYAPSISDRQIREIYDYLEKPENKVILTEGMLCFASRYGAPSKAFVITPSGLGKRFDRIELSSRTYSVYTPRNNSFGSGSGSGCSGCSGCSSNNNNNNNG